MMPSMMTADYIQGANLTMLRVADTAADASMVAADINAGMMNLQDYLFGLANQAKDTTSAILSIFQMMGATADSATLDTETHLIASMNSHYNTAAGWVAMGASVADSNFSPTFASDYKNLGVDDFINKVTQAAFGTAMNTPALHNELAIYQDFFQHYADPNDPTGAIRARGGFIADMLHEASDYATQHPGTSVGQYEQASGAFLVGLVEGTTHYGQSIFG